MEKRRASGISKDYEYGNLLKMEDIEKNTRICVANRYRTGMIFNLDELELLMTTRRHRGQEYFLSADLSDFRRLIFVRVATQ